LPLIIEMLQKKDALFAILMLKRRIYYG